MTPRLRVTSVRGLLSFLWRAFGFIGAVLGLRRWWRTLTNSDEPRSTRLTAAFFLLVMATLLVLSLFRPYGGRHQASAPSASASASAQELVVDLRDDLSRSAVNAVGREYGVEFVPNSPEAVDERLMLADVSKLSAARRAALLDRLRADSRVEAADENFEMQLMGWRIAAASPARGQVAEVTPNDPRYPEQWHLNLIGMPRAWEKSTGKGCVVAVIDTGCAFEKKDDIPAASDLKGTRFTKPFDFITNTKRAYDDHGHGTHVAGTIAQATNNGHGCAGVAYDATIMPLKVLTQYGSGTVADIANAVEYAANNGANVINMSLGGPRAAQVLAKACRYANQRGVTIVCAAGNSGREGVGYPAAYPECIAVSSVGPDGNLAFYSSWGEQVCIAAPGGNYRGEAEKHQGVLQNTVFNKQDVFEFWQGTSMASPHAAGVAALIWQTGVKGPAGIRAKLRDTATPKDDAKKYGAGVINAAAAVGASAASATVQPARVSSQPTYPVPAHGPLAFAVALLALAAVLLRQARRPLFWLGGALPVLLLCCVATGFAGRLVTPVAGTAVWPFLLLAGLFGVRGLRGVLIGVCAGWFAGAAAVGLLGWGPTPWLLANAAVAGLLGWMAARE
ncbi:MAG: peptidase S8 [Armatimonadetes bacterium]|nr:peptidase S8 [Armatimonadota bacterium]